MRGEAAPALRAMRATREGVLRRLPSALRQAPQQPKPERALPPLGGGKSANAGALPPPRGAKGGAPENKRLFAHRIFAV